MKIQIGLARPNTIGIIIATNDVVADLLDHGVKLKDSSRQLDLNAAPHTIAVHSYGIWRSVVTGHIAQRHGANAVGANHKTISIPILVTNLINDRFHGVSYAKGPQMYICPSDRALIDDIHIRSASSAAGACGSS